MRGERAIPTLCAMTVPLQMNNDGLGEAAAWCEALAGRLSGQEMLGAAGSSWLASHATVSAANARVAAAGARCAARVAATADNLAAAAAGYADNEARSASRLRGLQTPRAC
ncbi:MAG: hypothetical protein CK429_29785 [Mycobacterium sp.]|nr:MAG: hypothetical protein CK429_29785 [Mycobacterium sp.]PJE11846.1 MAG: hypothetical protein CK428_13700 [Mycobacterium sp.]